MTRQAKPSMADVISAAGSTRRIPAQPDIAPTPAAAPPSRPRTRLGTKMIAGHFSADVSWQLRALAVERRTTVQDLLAEALNGLFASYGKPEIASATPLPVDTQTTKPSGE